MKFDHVDMAMVMDMLMFIQLHQFSHEAAGTLQHLPSLYKLMGSNASATSEVWDIARNHWTENTKWIWPIVEFVSRKIGLETMSADKISDQELVIKVDDIKNRIHRVGLNMIRAYVFNDYWETLYELKRSGFNGRIAIVNHDYILDDLWIQSLFGIFGRNNTVIERVCQL